MKLNKVSIGGQAHVNGATDPIFLKSQLIFQLIYQFSAISIKTPANVFVQIIKHILKFKWKEKWLKITKKILRENKVELLTEEW